MRQSIQRRSFLKCCLAGGAGLLADSYGWTGSLRAQTASSGAPAKFHPTKTLCGLFNIPSLEIAKRMGAQSTRLIFGTATLDADIAAARSGALPPRFQLVKDLSAAGIPVMATYNWLNKKKGGGKLPEPNSDEWKKWLETGRGFVQVLAPYLVGITLENEPFLNYPELASEKGGGSARAYDWFKAVAAMVRETAPQLLISTPALVSPKGRKDKGVDHFFGWAGSDPNIDVADVHCHVADTKEIEAILSFTASKFTRGIIITEWSQAGRLRPWAAVKLNAAFAAKWKREPSLTNEKYIIQCEAHPVAGPGDSRVSLAEWNDFVATAPIDPNFMMDAFKVIQKHGVLMADYGAAIQYGSPHFDVKQLYANLSVVPGPDGRPQPNYKFPEWYKAMAAAA